MNVHQVQWLHVSSLRGHYHAREHMVSPESLEGMRRVTGRHSTHSNRHRGWVIGAATAIGAVATAVALTLGGTPVTPTGASGGTTDASATSQQLTSNDITLLSKLTPAQQIKMDGLIANSLQKAGIKAGTGTMPTAGTELTEKTWSWGYNRTDIWFIASWHDVKDGAILAAGAYCTGGLAVMGLGAVGAAAGTVLCGSIVGLALHMAAGKVDTTKAGLWITLY